MSRPVESVLLVGRDAALWLTALGLQRAFGRTGVKIRVLELPSELAPADVFASMPTLRGLHQLLGLDEAKVMAACAGTFALAQRFSRWSNAGSPFVHAYDTQGAGLNNVEFVQYWTKARAEGMNVQLEDFSLGAAAAKFGRFIVHSNETETFSKATYGYNLDARAYVGLVRAHALGSGVEPVAGDIAQVRVDQDRIAAVVLGDGRELQADLFIDASGSDAVLIGAHPDDEVEDWSRWLPCDRMLSASGKRLTPLPAFSEISAHRAGWVGLYPLQTRTGVIAMFDSRHADEAELRGSLPQQIGLMLEDVSVRTVEAAGRSRPWLGNCVAVGAGAASLDMMDAAPLHVIHTGLSHLVSFFPVDADHMVEAKPYNAAIAAHAVNIRDFQVAHYALNGRTGEPFWDAARAVPPPEGLAYKIDLFGARGRIALYDDETFQDENWTAIFVGHGLIPRAYDPLVDRVAREEQIQQFQRMLRFIAVETQEMPSMEAHMELSAPRQPGGAMF